MSITPVGKNEVLAAIKNKIVNDFEDGLEYYAAANCNCDATITEDINDFYFSPIPIYTPKTFLEKILV